MTVHNRLVLAGTYDNTVEIRNVFYYKTVFTTIGQTQAQDIFNTILLDTGFIGVFANTVAYTGVYLSHWTGPSDGIWWQETEPHRKPDPPWTLGNFQSLSGMAGTTAGDDMGPVPAVCITAYTALKRVRGHKYFCGIPENVQNKGLIAGTLATNAALFAAAYQLPITIGSDQATPELWGYRWGFNEITSAISRVPISTQRHRKYGRGV